MRWLDIITNSMDMNLGKFRDSEGQGGLACCTHCGCRDMQPLGHDLATEQQQKQCYEKLG